MTIPLDPETKRLRGMTPAQLADQVGGLKAQIAAVDEQLELIKQECVRRNLTSAEGALFDITLSPPGESTRIDKGMLTTVFGVPFVEHFSKTSPGTSWTLRCTAKKQRAKAVAIAA